MSTQSVRTMQARAAAHLSWSRTPDPTARTAPARDAFLARFEQQVDPDGVLDAGERTRRALHARTAHMQMLAARSAQARARRSA